MCEVNAFRKICPGQQDTGGNQGDTEFAFMKPQGGKPRTEFPRDGGGSPRLNSPGSSSSYAAALEWENYRLNLSAWF